MFTVRILVHAEIVTSNLMEVHLQNIHCKFRCSKAYLYERYYTCLCTEYSNLNDEGNALPHMLLYNVILVECTRIRNITHWCTFAPPAVLSKCFGLWGRLRSSCEAVSKTLSHIFSIYIMAQSARTTIAHQTKYTPL